MAVFNDTEYQSLRASLLSTVTCISLCCELSSRDNAVTVLQALAETLMELRRCDQDLASWLLVGYKRCAPDEKVTLTQVDGFTHLVYHSGNIDRGGM